MNDWLNKFITPRMMENGHLYLTVVWIILIIPSALLWNSSVPYLVAISVYAVITGHISSWQAARVERLQDDDDDVAEVNQNVQAVMDRLENIERKLDSLPSGGYRKEYGTDQAQ